MTDQNGLASGNDASPSGGRRWMAALPLAAFVGLAGLFALRLFSAAIRRSCPRR